MAVNVTHDISPYESQPQLRARYELAQALMKPPEGDQGSRYMSPLAPVADVVRALAGQYVLGKTGAQDIAQQRATASAMPQFPGAPVPSSTSTAPNPKQGAAVERSLTAAPGATNQGQPEGSGSPLSPQEHHSLTQTVLGEAANEPFEGKVAVAATALNRLKSGNFGDSMDQVIHAKNQFEPWNTPAGRARMASYPSDHPSYREAADAVNAALAGKDPTGGATYFFAPRAQASLGRKVPTWADPQTQTASIGGHVFFAPGGRVQPTQPEDDSGPALAFSGESPNAPKAIARALSPRAAPSKAAPGAPAGTAATPDAPPGSQYIQFDPRYVPQRPQVSRESFEHLMGPGAAYLKPEQGQSIWQMYYEQGKPIDIPYPGGKVTLPVGSSQGLYTPELQKTMTKAGGAEIPGYETLTPGGKIKQFEEEKPVQPTAPAPATRPAPTQPAGGGPQDFTEPAEPTPKTRGMNGPKGVEAGPAGQMMPNQEEDFGPDLTRQVPAGPLGTPPPQTAQAIPRGRAEFMEWAKQREIDTKRQEEFNKKDIEYYDKRYSQTVDNGRIAQEQISDIKLARRLIEDSRFIQGAGADIRIDWERLKGLIKSDPQAAALNQAFDKLVSGNIVKSIGPTLQGTGQVRMKEIDLLEKAAASRYNSLGANRAVLTLMQRALERQAKLAEIANQYHSGYRWGTDGKVMRDSNGNAVMSRDMPSRGGLDETIRNYLDHNPLVPEKEIDNYMKLFENDEKKVKGAGSQELPPDYTIVPRQK